MFQGMEILGFLLIIGFLAAALVVVLLFVAIFFLPPGAPATPRATSDPEQMDEGDMHSGPYGYSPNTAYSETQYGSMFDEEADWNEEER
jgi:hypothetical protein